MKGPRACVRATVCSGRGEAARFVMLPWVRAALRAALGADPFPGTLNLRASDAAALAALKAGAAAIPLPAAEEGFCDAALYPVHVRAPETGARASGLLVVPGVRGYPADVAEVVASVHLRSRLGVRDGDPVVLAPEAE